MSDNVLLCSTMHYTTGMSLGDVRAAAAAVARAGYSGWVIKVTKGTESRFREQFIRQLREQLPDSQDFVIKLITEEPTEVLSKNGLEADHMHLLDETFKLAIARGIDRIQFTDGDRIMNAINFPEELAQMAREVKSHLNGSLSYLNLARSETALHGHHLALWATESVFNDLHRQVLGADYDLGSGAHAMSTDLVQAILSRARSRGVIDREFTGADLSVYPHFRWLVTAKELGATMAIVRFDHVVGYETALQFRGAVEENIGGASVWDNSGNVPRLVHRGGTSRYSEFGAVTADRLRQEHLATMAKEWNLKPGEWTKRLGTVDGSIAFLRARLPALGIEPGTVAEAFEQAEHRVAGIREMAAEMTTMQAELRDVYGYHAMPFIEDRLATLGIQQPARSPEGRRLVSIPEAI